MSAWSHSTSSIGLAPTLVDTPVTCAPEAINRRHKCWAMKPRAPVTSTRAPCQLMTVMLVIPALVLLLVVRFGKFDLPNDLAGVVHLEP